MFYRTAHSVCCEVHFIHSNMESMKNHEHSTSVCRKDILLSRIDELLAHSSFQHKVCQKKCCPTLASSLQTCRDHFYQTIITCTHKGFLKCMWCRDSMFTTSTHKIGLK